MQFCFFLNIPNQYIHFLISFGKFLKLKGIEKKEHIALVLFRPSLYPNQMSFFQFIVLLDRNEAFKNLLLFLFYFYVLSTRFLALERLANEHKFCRKEKEKQHLFHWKSVFEIRTPYQIFICQGFCLSSFFFSSFILRIGIHGIRETLSRK